MPWDLVVVLPAAALPVAVEAGDTAIVPHTDPRYRYLVTNQPSVARFLGAFRSAFGVQLQPSIVIRARQAARITMEDLTALRNIVALAAVVKARTDRCIHRFGGQGPVYADLFEMYPVSLAKDGETVLVNTAAEFGLDDGLGRFQGQPHPAYIYPENVRPELDGTLLASLLRLWRSSVRRGKGGRFRRRIFRSLEMVYVALASPFRHMGSGQDHAVALSLWVSALETLAHPETRNVHFTDVEKLILSVPWYERRLTQVVFAPIEYRKPRPGSPGPTPLPRTTRPVRAYQRLYRVRNECLHGGRLPLSLITGGTRWNHLHEEVPALYRGVLLQALSARRLHKYPKEPKDWRRYGHYLDKRQDYLHYERPLYELCRHRRNPAG